MQESKKCPRCGNGLEKGDNLNPATMRKKGDLLGDSIVPFYCKNCGYIELYNQKYLKT
jgi:predicted nucleic-acid-binding Zn-ribbon protein